MMIISGIFTVFELDKREALKKLDTAVRDLQESAASEFLLAAQAKVPVLTGQAKATLAPLAREIGILGLFDFTPDSPHVDQREELRAQGQTESRGESLGNYEFQRIHNNYILRIASNLGYYDTWETQPTPAGRGRWMSYPEGRRYFIKYVQEHGHEHLNVFQKPSPLKRKKVTF